MSRSIPGLGDIIHWGWDDAQMTVAFVVESVLQVAGGKPPERIEDVVDMTFLREGHVHPQRQMLHRQHRDTIARFARHMEPGGEG